jgi:hypothetical protein
MIFATVGPCCTSKYDRDHDRRSQRNPSISVGTPSNCRTHKSGVHAVQVVERPAEWPMQHYPRRLSPCRTNPTILGADAELGFDSSLTACSSFDLILSLPLDRRCFISKLAALRFACERPTSSIMPNLTLPDSNPQCCLCPKRAESSEANI